MEQPTSCFGTVFPGPTKLRKDSRCEWTEKSKNKLSQFGKKEILLSKVSCLKAWDGRRIEKTFFLVKQL